MSGEPAAATAAAGPPGPRYARLSRRLRAYVIDVIIVLVVLVGALFAASVSHSDNVARTLGFAALIGLVVYEPLLVALTGSSVGHYLTNLRVVDNRTHGNVGIVKAVARTLIKSILGWYSFITMATTRRHQAVHDLLTKSTVQIRDPAKAASYHYVAERLELSSPIMPSRVRRLAVIGAYLFGSFLLFLGVLAASRAVGALSSACFATSRCSRSEELWLNGLSLGWLGISALSIIQGWRGRLFGCRRGRASADPDLSSPAA